MSDFARTHAALFDELERQGIFCADVVKLTQAVIAAQAVIERTDAPPLVLSSQPYHRCEACE